MECEQSRCMGRNAILMLLCSHLDLKGNMIKAMMVLNWLNMLEVETFYQ